MPSNNSRAPKKPLTQRSFNRAVRSLCDSDRDFEWIVGEIGPPPMWEREGGFDTLVHIILEQQVSLASAKAVYDKLLKVCSPLTPRRFLKLDDVALRSVGFSRQKTSYCRELARVIRDGELDLDTLPQLDNDAVGRSLTAIKGVGPWTVSVYLLMVLKRPDIWPSGDLALAVAVREVKGLAATPKARELEALGRPWSPWRSVAARILWHYYLHYPERAAIRAAGLPKRSRQKQSKK